MGEYDSSVALAQRLLTKKGASAILRSTVVSTPPDPSKPWIPGPSTPTDQNVKALFLNYAQKYIDGTLIRTGDQQVYLPSMDITGAPIFPAIDGLIIRGTEKPWKIIGIDPLKPGEQQIMFTVQVRQ